MEVFYQTGFWVLVSAAIAGAGTYGLYYRGTNKKLESCMTKDECEKTGEYRAMPFQRDIDYLKESMIRIEAEQQAQRRLLEKLLRAVDGGP